jgi:hypothetical protein
MFLEYQVVDPDDPTSARYQMPIFEYLTLGSDDVGVRGFSVHLSGFGVGNIRNPIEGDRFSGDVLVGTVAYRTPKGMFSGRLGRQILSETGTTRLMDGLYLKLDPGARVELSAYGGFVPYPRFGYDAMRVVFGGRVGYNPFDWGRIGLSFTEERDDVEGEAERALSHLGVDYALRRWRWIDLSGFLLADMVDGGIAESRTVVTTTPHRWVKLSVDYGLFDPSARIPKTSIFSVFTDTFYHAIGGDVALRTDGWLAASAYGRYFLYGEGDDGYQVGIRPSVTFRRATRDQVGIEASRLKAPTNAYWQARAYGIWSPFRGADVTLDVDNYLYDSDVKGFDRSHIVRLTAGYEVFRNARVQGDVAVTVNPDFEQMVSGLVKFTYAFSEYVK